MPWDYLISKGCLSLVCTETLFRVWEGLPASLCTSSLPPLSRSLQLLISTWLLFCFGLFFHLRTESGLVSTDSDHVLESCFSNWKVLEPLQWE